MSGYYYILSSLPFLLFDSSPPLTYAQFLEQCAPWLLVRERTQLELARIDIENIPHERVSHGMLKAWIAFENTLRNEIAKTRAKRLAVSPDEYLREDLGFRADVPSLVEQALRDPSPLKVEMHLLETRWQFLTDSESCHHFDLTVLMIYGLKLQILERMHKFDEEKGERVLNRIYERSFDES